MYQVVDAVVQNPDLTNILNSLAHSVGLAGVTVYGLQWLKKASWFPFLSSHTSQINSLVSTLVAIGVGAGIQISWTGNSADGWHFAGAIPAAHVVMDGVFRSICQKLGQEFLFRTIVKTPAEVAIVPPEKMNVEGKPVEQ